MTEVDQMTKYETFNTTCKGAHPNFENGKGDNLWAFCILILACIFGRAPTIDYGLEPRQIFECIRKKKFYEDFKNSKTYQKFYKDDKEFQPVDEILQMGLVKDPESRQENFYGNTPKPNKYKWKMSKLLPFLKSCKVDKQELRTELAKYCDAFDKINLQISDSASISEEDSEKSDQSQTSKNITDKITNDNNSVRSRINAIEMRLAKDKIDRRHGQFLLLPNDSEPRLIRKLSEVK